MRGTLRAREKTADVATTLLPHQQRVVDRLRQEGQSGLVVAHGLGSGKTLTSIAAQEALGLPSTVVLPASLRANYEKERQKHLEGETQEADIQSLQGVARRKDFAAAPMLIVDEAHRLRDPSTSSYQALKGGGGAEKRMLLTATPFYNDPSDIAPLVNIASGQKVLPTGKTDFRGRYVTEQEVKPGWWGRTFRGETPGMREMVNPRTVGELRKAFQQYVDYHPSSKEGFPGVTYEDVKVPMSREQLKVYDSIIGAAPPWVAAKIKSGLPPSKQEAQDLNAFLTGARQVALSTAAHAPDKPVEAPKIRKAFEDLQKTLGENERAKAVIYSNYLESGLDPYAHMLEQAQIPFGTFRGDMKKKDRDQMVKDYNEGKLRALMLSSAGGEGLDLKGTRLMQVLEPHWNIEKLRQVEGRGIRYGSHADLPEAERNVAVKRYLATRPQQGLLERIGWKDPGMSADEYLMQLSGEKENLNEQFRKLLPGYVKTSSAQEDPQKCLRATMALVNKNPRLKVMMGPADKGYDSRHFWAEDKKGNVHDPTRSDYGRYNEGTPLDMKANAGFLRKFAELAEDGEHELRGHLRFQGLRVAVENKKGDVRSGKDKDGKPWRTVMKHPYGYLEAPAKGKDGESIDVYVGPKKNAPDAFVVHQHKDNGKGHDEDKVMLGFGSEDEARKAYLAHYDDPKFLGPISTVPVDKLKEMVERKERITKISAAQRAFIRRFG